MTTLQDIDPKEFASFRIQSQNEILELQEMLADYLEEGKELFGSAKKVWDENVQDIKRGIAKMQSIVAELPATVYIQ